MRFENTEVWGFKHAIRGMRNPMASWKRIDSYDDVEAPGGYHIGEKDMDLIHRLINSGAEHRKFMRQIFVSVDITAPQYWWNEFDTYKVGVVENSTSKMHKLTSHPITIDCFEIDDFQNIEYPYSEQRADLKHPVDNDVVQMVIIPYLEYLRQKYNKTHLMGYFKELIRWLPESWLQKRTVTMSYENVFSIIRQRRLHKLNEWSGKYTPSKDCFIGWAKTLPYADDLLFYGLKKDESKEDE